MKRRTFSKAGLLMSLGAITGLPSGPAYSALKSEEEGYREPSRDLPATYFDVVVVGGGTAGVVAALAAARQGVKTLLVEAKGYAGGTVTEGGTALHSFYNLWKAFPGVEKKQVVRGIPQEIIDRMTERDATTGHAEMERGFDYDSVCTAIDTEMYKLVTMELLEEAGVTLWLNTWLADTIKEASTVKGVILESRSGREAVFADSFIDCTAYGDLAAHAGAGFTEPNDYAVCNSVGLGNVHIEDYYNFLKKHDAVGQLAKGIRSGEEGQLVRLSGRGVQLPEEFHEEARRIGMSYTTTTVHDNYLMFIKVNYKMPVSPTDRNESSKTELILRKNQARAVELFREYIPGCEKVFIARTAPNLNIRRGRLIESDYDITHEDVIEGRHFNDDVFVYGFHDSAPRYQIKDGGTYGFPYRALLAKGIDNLYLSGMMITSDHRAHMSTRNTVSCMAQGQAAGTAAALCSLQDTDSRGLSYTTLRSRLEKDGVYFTA